MKSIFKLLPVCLLISLYLFACSSKEKGEPTDSYKLAAPSEPPPAEVSLDQAEESDVYEAATSKEALEETTPIPPSDAVAVTAKQIIKTAQVRIQVEKLKESKAAITKLVAAYGGYLATSNESRSSNEYTASFSIRVPSAKFEGLLEELLKQAIFVAENNVSAEDVTEEFVDIQTRLKTKRALEARYLELLKQAKTMTDILKLEAALQQIREEIESREGRLKYLQNQVGYSTIHLDSYEQVPYTNAPDEGFWSKLASGFGEGWNIFLGFAIGVVTLWPFWLVVACGAWLIRRWWKKRRMRKAIAG